MEPSNLSVPSEGFRDERIYKLKEQANKEYSDMKLQITNIEEVIRMFHDSVLVFHTTSLRYTEVLKRLEAETMHVDKSTF